ncbi:MAG: PocR ligand-binding domain-containing protein [Lentisphaeria bacterium]|nr:PocR ligand-binding domain-containing protein [Lentisphaeria bacterium]
MARQVQIQSYTARAFAELGKEKRLQEYSNIIFQLLGLVIDFISAEGETLRLSRGVHFNPYCVMLRKTPSGSRACAECDVANARKAALLRESICYSCYAGLTEIIYPLFDAHGTYIGSMTAGQFHLGERPLLTRKEVFELARRNGLSGHTLWNHYRKSVSLTAAQKDGLTGYLKIIGQHLTGIRDNLIFMDKIDMPDKIREVKHYLDGHYAEPLKLADMARRFSISPDYLTHMFRKEMNIAFHRYLVLRRLTEAEKMLSGTELSIREIAFHCGFGSISQFNRFFKSEKNCTPGLYRSKNWKCRSKD